MTKAAKRKSNRPFWILLAVTGLPFIAAWVVFFNPSLLGEPTLGNRGELVAPTRPIPALRLDTIDGAGFDTAHLRDHWTLISVSSGTCDQDCETNLYHLRQIRLAMGEERDRIQRVLIVDGQMDEGFAEKLKPFKGTLIVTGPTEEREIILGALGDAKNPETLNRVFLVDPLGNLMMTYGAVPPATDVLKDLERLLKVVQL